MRMARAAERSAAERLARGGVRTDLAVSVPAMHSQVPARPGEHLTLMPGQLHFGGHAATLRTLLGSCLAVALWHPERCLGGMCHFLLPSRQRRGDEPLDGRYGDEALEALVNMLRAARCAPAEFHAHLYGGADTMPEGGALKFNVGARNIEQGFNLVDRYGFQIQGVDVGEDVPRTVVLTLATGEVSMRRGDGAAPQHHLQASLTRSKP
jgi:chemotaxis protein CheD